MPIQAQIEQDYLAAFKGHDQPKVDVLRLLKAAIKNEEIKLRDQELTDEQIVSVLTREAKKRKESIVMYQQGHRPEQAALEQAELEAIAHYLPAQLSDADLDAVVIGVMAGQSLTAKDFGQVMGAVMAKVKGQADGNRVSAAVKRQLK